MTTKITKAIIPAAGMGTRFLPVTKSMPKEMLPIIDTPVLQYVVEEAIAAGITDILIITSRGKQMIENHFDYNRELELFLVEAGKEKLVEVSRNIGRGANIHYIRQKVQAGLGDAIRLGRYHVGHEPFAVLLGDTIIGKVDDRKSGLQQLCDVFAKTQASVVAVQEVPHEWVSRYGVVDGTADAGNPNLLKLKGLVEKPKPENAPSNLAIDARYIFTADIFDCLDKTAKGHGGEIQLTDAMNMLAQTHPMYALAWQAHRYDIGDRVEYAKCFIDYALQRADTGPAVREYLKGIMGAGQ